jgi:hypothetical protein
MADQGWASPHQGVEIRRFVVGGARLPAAIEDADPLKCQGAGCGLMSLASGSLLGIVGTCPEGMADGFAGPFHEGLAQELRALEAPVDPTCVPTTFGDWRNARILLEVGGGGIALALFAKGHEEAWGEDGAGTWERLKEGEVGMGWGQLCNSAVEVLDRLQGGTELGHKGADQADMGRDDSLVCRERHGRLNRLKALSNDTCLHMMLAQEARQGGTAS